MKLAFMLLVVVLVVYWQAAFDGLRRLLGAQPDLLPSLVVYAALAEGLGAVALVSLVGGLFMDSLSANPLGLSVLPLFLSGFLMYGLRGLLLRDQLFAQVVLGAGAAAVASVLSLLFLLSRGDPPPLGWGTLWQLLVMIVGPALTTPVWFVFFDWSRRALSHQRLPETTFRSDREIRRGR